MEHLTLKISKAQAKAIKNLLSDLESNSELFDEENNGYVSYVFYSAKDFRSYKSLKKQIEKHLNDE